MNDKDGINNEPQSFIGFDVSKAAVDAFALPDGESRRFNNDDPGLKQCLAWVQSKPDGLCVVEATGGYETALASLLAAAGVRIAVINPKHVRDFAKAFGILAKTDRVDARVLALLPINVVRAFAHSPMQRSANSSSSSIGVGNSSPCAHRSKRGSPGLGDARA
jgi:hypothetical protein